MQVLAGGIPAFSGSWFQVLWALRWSSISRLRGFAPCEALWRHVAGVLGLWMASLPPLGGVKASALGPVVAKVQIHWAKNAENVLFWLNGSALWRMWSLAMVLCSHVDPLVGVVNRYAARRTASRSVNNTSLSPTPKTPEPSLDHKDGHTPATAL